MTRNEYIEKIAKTLLVGFLSGKVLYIIGNGGSAADASHIAAEFMGRYAKERPPLPAIPLTDPGIISCIANDFGWEEVFARQVEAVSKTGGLLLALTTSGLSENVIEAVNVAKENGMYVIGLTGSLEFAERCDIGYFCDHSNTAIIQQDYMDLMHAVCEKIDQEYG